MKVLDSLELPEAKTKQFAAVLKSLEIERGAIVVFSKADRNVLLAARNVPKVETVLAGDLNAYQVLKYHTVLVVGKDTMEKLKERLSGSERKAS